MNVLKSIYRSFFPAEISGEELAQVKGTVERMISNGKVAVFSKSYCPYCNQAKALLSELKQPMEVMELDHRNDGAAIQAYLASRINAGRVTVPQIYIKGQHVGGCSDLTSLHSAGKLQSMLS